MSDNENILSQEEIDALLNPNNDDQEDTLTSDERDVLGEIGNIVMGSAATTLYTILDQKVEITTPEVNVVSFDEIIEEYARPCVLVKVKYVSGLEGFNLLIIKEEDATIIADLMMGGDGIDPEIELNDIYLSAVGEAMNQMMGSASTAASSIINEVVNISPPETKYLDLQDVIKEQDFFADGQKLIDTSFRLKIGDLIDSSFRQLAPLEFSRRFAARLLDVNSGGLTAKNDNPQDEKVGEDVEREMEKRTEQKPAGQRTQSVPPEQQPAPNRQQAETRNRQTSRQVTTTEEENVGVKRAQFPDFDQSQPVALPHNMGLIEDVPLQVTVRLGKSRMTIKDILDLGEGSIVELDKLAGEPVDLLVNGKLVAKGEVVVIDENFGFRVKDIVSPMERVNNL